MRSNAHDTSPESLASKSFHSSSTSDDQPRVEISAASRRTARSSPVPRPTTAPMSSPPPSSAPSPTDQQREAPQTHAPEARSQTSTTPVDVILDCDTTVDDALAILVTRLPLDAGNNDRRSRPDRPAGLAVAMSIPDPGLLGQQLCNLLHAGDDRGLGRVVVGVAGCLR